MSIANPLWGAPRIHGELLKFGIDIGQTTVAKYMTKGRRPPSQGWRTFLRNHADGITSMDLFVVPTISFRLLYELVILQHRRREMLWLGVTAHPTAEWLARQVTEACGWENRPRYILRDRDSIYGAVFLRRLRAMGIRDRPTAARSPWQNGYCERLIGSIRRDCLDHVIVFGEQLTPESPITEGQQVQLRFKGKEVLVRVTKVETPQKTYERHIVGFPSADTPLELDGLKPGDIVGFSHDRIARVVT